MDTPINELAAKLGLQSLRYRRFVYYFLFLYCILNEIVDCLDVRIGFSKSTNTIPISSASSVWSCVHHTSKCGNNTEIGQEGSMTDPTVWQYSYRNGDFFHDSLVSIARASLAVYCQHSTQ